MDLQEIRRQIDGVDDGLSELFVRRMNLSGEVAKEKAARHLPLQDSEREREIVCRLTEGLDDEMAGYVQLLYTDIFNMSKTHQSAALAAPSAVAAQIDKALAETPPLMPKSAVVACQGMEGANSAAACEKMFARPSILYMTTFEGVFSAVEKGLCRYGVLPIENSLHGSVTNIYDHMKNYRFYIVQSIKLKINHALLAKPGVTLGQVKKIYSHEQALAQCSAFLGDLKAEIVPCENTAAAAKMVAEAGGNAAAAISSADCADLYGLVVLQDNIQNSDNNYTRFICISKQMEIYPGANKVSLMMTLPHKPGALYHLMAKFAALGINLTKLESRPIPGSDFEFMFYFDFEVSVYDKAVERLLAELEADGDRFQFLGCYSEL